MTFDNKTGSYITIKGLKPIGKPRMTGKSAIYSKTAKKFWEYKDALLKAILGDVYKEGDKDHNNKCIGEKFKNIKIVKCFFYIEMPKSWSKDMKKRKYGKPHDSKPDIDNLLKGIMDSLFEDDKGIYFVVGGKYWSDENAMYLLLQNNT